MSDPERKIQVASEVSWWVIVAFGVVLLTGLVLLVVMAISGHGL